jgi:hypothetical protein
MQTVGVSAMWPMKKPATKIPVKWVSFKAGERDVMMALWVTKIPMDITSIQSQIFSKQKEKYSEKRLNTKFSEERLTKYLDKLLELDYVRIEEDLETSNEGIFYVPVVTHDEYLRCSFSRLGIIGDPSYYTFINKRRDLSLLSAMFSKLKKIFSKEKS